MYGTGPGRARPGQAVVAVAVAGTADEHESLGPSPGMVVPLPQWNSGGQVV